ncbi:hypothetical protein ACFW9M_02725 [Streptomyces lydicus]
MTAILCHSPASARRDVDAPWYWIRLCAGSAAAAATLTTPPQRLPRT